MIPVCLFTVLYNLPKFFELRTKIVPVFDEYADRNMTIGNLTDMGAVPVNQTAFIGVEDAHNFTWTNEMIEVRPIKEWNIEKKTF